MNAVDNGKYRSVKKPKLSHLADKRNDFFVNKKYTLNSTSVY